MAISHLDQSKDIDQIQMIEDVLNLTILDCGKLLSLSPNAIGANQTSEHGLLSELNVDGSMLSSGNLLSSFSFIVDEVFELEKGMKVGTSSPKRKGGTQIAQINNAPKVYGGSPHYNNSSIYSTSNLKGIMQSSFDLVSLRSPHSANSCATMDLSSPPRLTGPRVSAPTVKPNGPRTSAIGSYKPKHQILQLVLAQI
ncbi:unnamed protein product [Camellia sinensis]